MDNDDRSVHVALKGTSDKHDILSDAHVMLDNTSGHEKEIQTYLESVIDYYDGQGYNFDVSSHSLGSTELINIFTQEKNDKLDQYKEIRLFNPAVMPTHNLSNARQALHDKRMFFFLNSGDMVSNTFGNLADQDSQVMWIESTHSPLYNHGISQWVGDV